jgi:hypothetical protein
MKDPLEFSIRVTVFIFVIAAVLHTIYTGENVFGISCDPSGVMYVQHNTTVIFTTNMLFKCVKVYRPPP